MAANTKKVFDVAKPGNSTPDTSSRPVIVGHKPQVEDPMVSKTASAVPKIIPISSAISSDTEENKKADTDTAAASSALSSVNRIKITPPSREESRGNDDAETQKDSPGTDKKTEEAPVVENAADKDGTVGNGQPPASDSAAVDALAQQATLNKKGSAIEEEATKQDALEKIIESKKYNVIIKESKARRSLKHFLFALLILIVMVLAGINFAIDAGLIDTNIFPTTNFISN